MPTFLSDPSQTTYLMLVVAAVVASAVWYRTRKRKVGYVAAGVWAVVAAVFLIDYLVESPREEATRRVVAMAAAATARSPDQFVEHLSASFNYNGAGRDRVRASGAWNLIRQHNARVVVNGLGHDETAYLPDGSVEVGFTAKAEAADGGFLFRYVKATFVRDPDGKHRLKGMKFYTPGVSGRNEDPIPGFP